MENMNIDNLQDNPAECNVVCLDDEHGNPVITIRENEHVDGSIDLSLITDMAAACRGMSLRERFKIATGIMLKRGNQAFGLDIGLSDMAFVQNWLNARYPVEK